MSATISCAKATASFAPLRNTVLRRESAATLNGLVKALPEPSSGSPLARGVNREPREKMSFRVEATVAASACFNSTLATSTPSSVAGMSRSWIMDSISSITTSRPMTNRLRLRS